MAGFDAPGGGVSFGSGQEVSDQRSDSTDYQNTTGGPLEVTVQAASNDGEIIARLFVHDETPAYNGYEVEERTDVTGETTNFDVRWVVPDGWYYQSDIRVGSITAWYEREITA